MQPKTRSNFLFKLRRISSSNIRGDYYLKESYFLSIVKIQKRNSGKKEISHENGSSKFATQIRSRCWKEVKTAHHLSWMLLRSFLLFTTYYWLCLQLIIDFVYKLSSLFISLLCCLRPHTKFGSLGSLIEKKI